MMKLWRIEEVTIGRRTESGLGGITWALGPMKQSGVK